jgi:hypothetical protein
MTRPATYGRHAHREGAPPAARRFLRDGGPRAVQDVTATHTTTASAATIRHRPSRRRHSRLIS